MNQPPDDLTQPIPSEPTAPQAAVPAADAAVPAADAVPAASADAAPAAHAPDWAQASAAGERPASDLPVTSPTAPVTGSAVPVASAAAPVAARTSWRSRVSGGKGLAVGALVVGLGLGAVGGSVATWAVVHEAHGVGTTADGRGFDHHGDGDFGRPDGDRGGFPPGGGQRPGDDQQQGGGGTLPGGGGGGTGGSSGSGTDANGTSQAT